MYRFGQVAAAIGITEPALRNWMTRDQLGIWGERPKGGWRAFTEEQVFALALTAELVSYGAKVMDAHEAVQIALASLSPGTSAVNLPPYLFAVRSQFGGWELQTDEAFAFGLAQNRSVVKIAPAVIIRDAWRRLGEAN